MRIMNAHIDQIPGAERGEDYRASSLVIFALLISVMLGACLGVSLPVLRGMPQPSRAATPFDSPESAPHVQEPRLQTQPQADLAALQQAQQHILQSYSFIDRAAGIVRVPIDQAID